MHPPPAAWPPPGITRELSERTKNRSLAYGLAHTTTARAGAEELRRHARTARRIRWARRVLLAGGLITLLALAILGGSL
jgi:hypothetical protein